MPGTGWAELVSFLACSRLPTGRVPVRSHSRLPQELGGRDQGGHPLALAQPFLRTTSLLIAGGNFVLPSPGRNDDRCRCSGASRVPPSGSLNGSLSRPARKLARKLLPIHAADAGSDGPALLPIQ